MKRIFEIRLKDNYATLSALVVAESAEQVRARAVEKGFKVLSLRKLTQTESKKYKISQ